MGGISAGRRWIWELDRAANWSNLLAGKKKKKVFWSEWAKIREGKCREKSRYVQYCETRDETKQSPLEFPSRHSMSGPLTRNRLLLLCCIVPLFETMPQHSRRSSDTPETRIRQPKKKKNMRVPTVGRVSTMGSKRIGSREREQRFRARLFTYAIVSHAVGVATRLLNMFRLIKQGNSWLPSFFFDSRNTGVRQ